MEYIVLNNGVKCPVIGIGTFMLSPVEAENSVREALKMGYSAVAELHRADRALFHLNHAEPRSEE